MAWQEAFSPVFPGSFVNKTDGFNLEYRCVMSHNALNNKVNIKYFLSGLRHLLIIILIIVNLLTTISRRCYIVHYLSMTATYLRKFHQAPPKCQSYFYWL